MIYKTAVNNNKKSCGDRERFEVQEKEEAMLSCLHDRLSVRIPAKSVLSRSFNVCTAVMKE